MHTFHWGEYGGEISPVRSVHAIQYFSVHSVLGSAVGLIYLGSEIVNRQSRRDKSLVPATLDVSARNTASTK
jgi:hypothetical protein